MKNLRIVFSNHLRETHQPYIDIGTNTIHLDKAEKFWGTENTVSIMFELEDNRIVDEFIRSWYIDKDNNNRSDAELAYNDYSSLTAESRAVMQQRMNNVIRIINKEYPRLAIPEDLILTVDGFAAQHDKLNRLHEYFEDTSNMFRDYVLEHRQKKLFILLEKINHYVHKMEGKLNKEKESMLTVVRNCYGLDTTQLTESDYVKFEYIQPGSLYLDFATVGKDLHHCVVSNDVELVRSNKVSPQEYIKPYFNFTMESIGKHSPTRIEYNNKFRKERMEKWIADNNLEEFIDITEPKHSWGRIKLGEIVECDYYKYKQIRKEYPYLYGVYIE